MRRFGILAALAIGGALPPLAAGAANPYLYPDDSFLSVSGSVTSVGADSFMLDFGEGEIEVEMDDGDRDADAYVLSKGDAVTVSGLLDDDVFEEATIEASSVYVEKLGTQFYSSAVDEEDYDFLRVTAPSEAEILSLQGRVEAVDAATREFSIDTGIREVDVDVSTLGYDPFDDEGYLKIDVGDVVNVTAAPDYGFIERRTIVADTITEIYE